MFLTDIEGSYVPTPWTSRAADPSTERNRFIPRTADFRHVAVCGISLVGRVLVLERRHPVPSVANANRGDLRL